MPRSTIIALAALLRGCSCEPAGKPPPPALTTAAPVLSALPRDRALEARVDDIVLAALAANHVPGASLTVVREGRVALQKAYGAAHLEPRAGMRVEARFAIASVTKIFTTLAVLRLVDERRVRLDGAIGEILPDVPAAWRTITVRQLLAMQSGIPWQARQRGTWSDLVAWAAGQPLDFAPGTRVAYSNTNFLLLGRIVEAAAGEGYPAVVERVVLRPAGMAATGPNGVSPPPGLVTGYVYRDGDFWEAAYRAPAVSWSSGWLVSNQPDLVKLDDALRGGRLVSRESQAAMFTPQPLANGRPTTRGLGWDRIFTRGGKRFAVKGGLLPGFRCWWVVGLDDGTSIILLMNASVKTVPGLVDRLLEAAGEGAAAAPGGEDGPEMDPGE